MLSVVLATYNEEKNIGDCLTSVTGLADEIVVVDGTSSDKTVEIAKKYKARVIVVPNNKMFHINKQKALDEAKGEWILQLDADERVTPELIVEIKKVIKMNEQEIEEYQEKLPERELFLRHQKIIEKRYLLLVNSYLENSKQQKDLNNKYQITNNNYTAFYIPRKNFFLGKFLRYGGVYPDGVIRLIKKGKARFPCRDVHELMEVDGKIGWLSSPILHYDSPTFARYLQRNSRYIDLLQDNVKCQMLNVKTKCQNPKIKNSCVICYMLYVKLVVDWLFIKPVVWFVNTTIRHKGILDGWRGIVFSFFSALRFPRAYIRFLKKSA